MTTEELSMISWRRESCSCWSFLFESLSPGYGVSLTAPPGGKERHRFKKKKNQYIRGLLVRLSFVLYSCSFGCRVLCECEAHCVCIRLLQPLVSRVQSLEGALDHGSSFCSAPHRVCDLERVGDTLRKTKLLHTRAARSSFVPKHTL